MNRIYKTLWSASTQSWQAVPETAKASGKKSATTAAGVVASVALSWVLTSGANAQSPPAINQLPTVGVVARGTATINQTATAQAAAMTVNQSSQRAVINWDTFNIGSKASVNFVQPNAQAVTLNRVNDSNPSQIFGRMTANGQVFLTNANGVYFSPTSSVDVGALTATTHSISNDNFMSGKYVFERKGATGKVINEGNISAALGGYVALLAPEVQNAGVVVARAGTVAMAAGEMITLNLDSNSGLAGITTTPSTIGSLIENKLAVKAPDGQIILSAVALNKVQAGVIKNSGNLEANSLVNKGGKIYLEGDDITLDRNSKIEAKGSKGGGTVLVGGDWQGSGDMRQATKVTMEAGATIDASATDSGDGGKVVLWSDIHKADSATRVNGSIKAEAGPHGGDGGQIETSGHYLNVDGIQISTQAPNGTTGEWLLDPWDITIDSSGATGTAWTTTSYTSGATSTILASSITGALGSGNNVTVTTGGIAADGNGSGNITINTDISWSSTRKLTLTALGGIGGTGNIAMSGAAGTGLVLDQAGNSTYSGNISGANASFEKKGVGLLTLTGNNSYGGGTTLTAGKLNLGSANAIGTSGTINLKGGTLQYSSANNTTDYSSRFGTTTPTYNIDSNGYDLTFAANLGSGSLTKSGLGTLTLTGTNTSLSDITISGGNLQIGNGGTSGALLSTNPLTVTTSSNTSLIFNRSDAIRYQYLTINGSGGLTQAGSGTLTFDASSGKKNYTGPTYVKTGVLDFGAAGPNTGKYPKLIVDLGARFNINGTNLSFGGLSGAGTLSTSATSSIVVGADNSDTEFSGTFTSTGASGTGLAIWKNGTGRFIYSGISGSDFRGFQANAGIIQVGKGGTEGSLGNTLTFTNGTFEINRSDATTLSGFNTSSGTGGTLRLTGTGTTTIVANSSNFYGTVELNAGTLSLGVPVAAGSRSLSTTQGSIVFGGGVLQFGAGDTNDYSSRFSTASNQNYKIDTNGQSVTFATDLTSSGGTLTKLGTGTLILNGANTYTGATTVSAGTLQVGNSTNTTAKLSSTTITSNSDLVFYRQDATTLSAMVPNIAGAIGGNGNVTVTSTGTLNVDKDITLTGANSTIKLLATSGAEANSSTTSDLTLTNTVTTTDTGSIAIFAGSPTATVANGSTANLNAKMAGAIGTLKYKVYNASSASLSSMVTGTRNFYYRVKPTPSISGISVNSKTYDGSPLASISYTSVTGLSADDNGLTLNLSFATSNFNNANAGTGKSVTLSGGITLSNASWNISGLAFTAPAVTGTINKADLVLSGTKVYDGTTVVTGSQLTATGVNSESFTVTGSGSVGNLSSADVQALPTTLSSVTGLALGVSSGTNTGVLTNYNDISTTGSSFSVTRATAKLSASKMYDGDNSLTGSQLTITGITANGTTQTLGYTGTAGLFDANVAYTNNYVTGVGLALANGTGLASNYVLPSLSYGVNNSASVTPKNVTVTLTPPPGAITYDGVSTYANLASNLTAFTNTPMVLAESIASIAPSVSDAGIAQAGNFTVTPGISTLGAGTLASNYNFTLTPLTVAVARAALSVNNTSVANKNYDGTRVATLSGGTLVGVLGADAITLTQAGTFATANVGSNIAVTAANSISGTAAGNYTLTQPTGLQADISKTNATVTANSATTTYTGLAQSVSGFTASGLVNGETAAVLSGVSAGVTRTNAGTYTATASGTDTNYNLTFVDGTLTINKANATVTANSATTTYNGLAQSASGFTASGLVNGETTAVLTGVSAGITRTNAGTYTATASGTDTNYNLTFVDGTLTINKANATVTANSATTTYNGLAQSASGFTASGLVNGETTSVLTGVTAGVTRTNAGTYTATASGTDTNYNVAFVDGTLTINKANLTKVTANKTYDSLSTVRAAQMTAIEGVNGETFAASSGVAQISDKNVVTANKTLTDLSGLTLVGNSNAALGANYNLSSNLPAAGVNNQVTVSAKALGLSIPGATRVYDGTTTITPSGPVTLSGIENNDQVNIGVGTVTGYVNKNVGNNKTVTYTGLALSGSDAQNYSLPVNPTSDANITQAPLSINGITAANKVYDGGSTATVNTSSVVMTGLFSGDAVSLSATGTFDNKNAGVGKTVNLNSVYSGADAANYAITDQLTTTATIDKAPLTVTANDAVKNFGAANPALTVALTGFVGGESVNTAGVTGVGSATTKATATTEAGTAVINAGIGTLAATNYAFTRFVDGTLTIRPIAVLNNDEVTTLIGAQLANLTGAQVGSFSANQLQVFSPQQLSSLSPSQLAGMTSAQLLSLSPVQIAAISPAKISLLSTSELSAFSDAQLQALSVEQIAAISPDHFSAFSPEQIMALSISQVINLTPEQLKSFSPAQIASLSAAELAYFDARQLAAIGIFPKAETTVAVAPPEVLPPEPLAPAVVMPVATASVEVPATPVIATPETQEVATTSPVTLPVETPTNTADTKDNRNQFEAAIPVMTDVAASNAPPVVAPPARAVSVAAIQPSTVSTPSAPQSLQLAPVAVNSAQAGVLAITILNGAEIKPTTTAVAFEQDANGVTLRTASASQMPPVSDKLVFNDKLTTFMVASASGEMVEFQGSLINKRLVIVAPTSTAKQVARNEMNMVLAAAITSLGTENRVMLANLEGVLLDLR